MTDEANPGTDKVRSKTMHPALRERLQRPIYQRASPPTGSAVIITGVRPPVPRPEPMPSSEPQPSVIPDPETLTPEA